MHLGTEPGSKAYRLYNPTTCKIVVNRYVIFDENKMWNWSNTETTKVTPGSFSITYGDFGNKGVSRDDNTVEEEEDEGVDNTEHQTLPGLDEEEDDIETSDHDEDMLRSSTRERKKPSYLNDYILLAELDGERLLLSINNKPWNFDEAKEEKVWRDACEDEIASIVKNKPCDLVDLPAGAKAIGL